jgi:hypothetical protein
MHGGGSDVLSPQFPCTDLYQAVSILLELTYLVINFLGYGLYRLNDQFICSISGPELWLVSHPEDNFTSIYRPLHRE